MAYSTNCKANHDGAKRSWVMSENCVLYLITIQKDHTVNYSISEPDGAATDISALQVHLLVNILPVELTEEPSSLELYRQASKLINKRLIEYS